MKTLSLTLAVFAAFLVVPSADAASYHSVGWYDKQTKIAHRWENNRSEVDARIRDNYSDSKTGEVDEKGIEKNTYHIGTQLVPCIRDLSRCKAKSTVWGD